MKTHEEKIDVKEDLGEETEEEHEEELPIEEAEKAEEAGAEEELEEAEERVGEEEVAKEGVLEEPIEEPTEEEEAIEEEEKPEKIEKKEVEEEIVEERVYTIPLSRAWISPPKKRAPRAIRIIKTFITKHMKIKTDATEEEAERLVISNEVNEKIWSYGIKNPPRNIRVRALKDKEGTVTLRLAEED